MMRLIKIIPPCSWLPASNEIGGCPVRLYPRRWPWQEGIARPASNDPVQRCLADLGIFQGTEVCQVGKFCLHSS